MKKETKKSAEHSKTVNADVKEAKNTTSSAKTIRYYLPVWLFVVAIIVIWAIIIVQFLPGKEKKETPMPTPIATTIPSSSKAVAEALDVDSQLVQELYQKINVYENVYLGQKANLFYQKKNTKVTDMNNQDLLYMAIANNRIKKDFEGKKLTETITLTKEEVEKSANQLFGHDVKLKHESLTNSPCAFAAFQYDSQKEIYTQSGVACADNKNSQFVTKVTKAVKKGEQVYLDVKGILILKDTKNKNKISLYRDVAGKESLALEKTLTGSYDFTDLFQTYGSKLTVFRFTFDQDGTDDYHFKTVKRID